MTNDSAETLDRLEIYARALEHWNARINLVGRSTIANKWHRHFLDSVQLWPLIPRHITHWVDIGSGAGFPGLVLAILAREQCTAMKITLVESNARKCAFLHSVTQAVDIDINIYNRRIESLNFLSAQGLSARALAPIKQLLCFSKKILQSDGMCLFLKGQNCKKELIQASKYFNFKAKLLPSITSNTGHIVKIVGIKN